jgi:protein TonB
MFEDSTFESQGRIHTRSKRWMVAALGFNGSILAALVLIPLIFPSMLPLHSMRYFVTTPEAPKAAPTLVHRASIPASASAARNILDPLLFPRRIPPSIIITSDPGPGDEIAMTSGGPDRGDGIPGGVGDDTFRRITPIVVRAEPNVMRVPARIEEGMIVSRTIPSYPIIAKTMGVQGTVVLAATISKVGTIENLRVVSGPVALQRAALDAVKTWRYKPYVLDGQPVEVETSVDVVFRIQR